MTRMICLRASSDCKRLTKHENTGLGWVIAASRSVCDTPPHNVRDVLATHILKQTGSYEQASYAIQDTPDMVAQHYGRFLPQDKAALAAKILNRVWEAA